LKKRVLKKKMNFTYKGFDRMSYSIQKRVLNIFGFSFVLSCLIQFSLFALTIDINQGSFQPIPIAIPAFTHEAGEASAQLSEVIASDLKNCGEFSLVSPEAYIQTSAGVLAAPHFSEWKPLNAQILLAGRVTESGGELEVECVLYDVFTGSLLLKEHFRKASPRWRQLAHQVADAIYKRVTGEEGYFNTKIVYVSQQGPRGRKACRLAVMDQDGANHSYLTSGKHLVLSPRFSPTAHEIAYMAFDTKPPSVHLMNLQTGQQQTIGQFQGMTFAPRFSPDGRKLVMSLSSPGVTSLYEMPLTTRKIERLTQTSGAIDTSASYSPDGARLVFNSDRQGTPQLYVMSARGGEPEQISFGKGRYYTPVWSPRGDWIAFIKSTKGTFYLGVIRPNGDGERIIAQGYLMESPTWSPNGRVLMFATQSSLNTASKIYSIDVTGHHLREVSTPKEATHPAWSPLIQD
jgi:TolB protein